MYLQDIFKRLWHDILVKKFSVLLLFLILASCSKQEPVLPLEKINFRNNIAYEINSTDPFSGIVIEYFEAEQVFIKSKTSYKDGKIEGSHEEYYESGQLKSKTSYKDGKIEGPYEEYYQNGQLKKKSYQVDEFFYEGVYQTYYENGQIKWLYFVTDAETGEQYGDQYDSSGNLISRTYLKIKDDTLPELDIESYIENFDMEGNITFRKIHSDSESTITTCDYLLGKISKRNYKTEQIFEIEGSPLDAEICNINESRFTYSVTVE